MEVGFDDDMARNELILELIGLECKLSYVYKLTFVILYITVQHRQVERKMTLALSIPAFVSADVNIQASKQASHQK